MRRVFDVIARELGVVREELTVDLRLADLGADSLDRLGLALRLEETFGIFIQDDAAARFRTVGDVVELVRRLIQERKLRGAQQ